MTRARAFHFERTSLLAVAGGLLALLPAAWAWPLLPPWAAALAETAAAALGVAASAAGQGASWTSALAAASYHQQPAATLALAGAAVVPALALAAAAAGLLARKLGGRAPDGADGPVAEARRTSSAWIEPDRDAARRVPIGEMARIGGDDDCDVIIGGSHMQGMHAIIQRRGDCEFFIIDVSANEDDRIKVNGRATAHGQLADGDTIELGGRRMTFRQPPVGWDRGGPSATDGEAGRREHSEQHRRGTEPWQAKRETRVASGAWQAR